jgi:ANTAR domain
MQYTIRHDIQPLPLSLEPLALIAAKEVRAVGYAIYKVDPVTESRELKYCWGAWAPESGEKGFRVVSFPLRAGETVTGILAFVLSGNANEPATRASLDRIAGAVEEVWRLSSLSARYAQGAARVAELETELADSKIADRALGMLARGEPPRDAIDTIVRHVESVLRPSELATTLGELTQQIEQEIAERELASRAKAILQKRYGMSEDQAHVHLRVVSRKSRKRLRDVAQDLLEEWTARDALA